MERKVIGTCSVCGGRATERHHVDKDMKREDPERYSRFLPEDVILVCEVCHRHYHNEVVWARTKEERKKILKLREFCVNYSRAQGYSDNQIAKALKFPTYIINDIPIREISETVKRFPMNFGISDALFEAVKNSGLA
jgi:hypothetical protein